MFKALTGTNFIPKGIIHAAVIASARGFRYPV